MLELNDPLWNKLRTMFGDERVPILLSSLAASWDDETAALPVAIDPAGLGPHGADVRCACGVFSEATGRQTCRCKNRRSTNSRSTSRPLRRSASLCL